MSRKSEYIPTQPTETRSFVSLEPPRLPEIPRPQKLPRFVLEQDAMEAINAAVPF